jgi:hypothetical protein
MDMDVDMYMYMDMAMAMAISLFYEWSLGVSVISKQRNKLFRH